MTLLIDFFELFGLSVLLCMDFAPGIPVQLPARHCLYQLVPWFSALCLAYSKLWKLRFPTCLKMARHAPSKVRDDRILAS
jgi:hypothetical protein